MTTSAAIEAAWLTAIWQHDTILDMTDKIHTYIVTPESEKEIGNLYYKNEVNYFQALTGRGQRYLQSSTTIGETIEYNYQVEVSYFREADREGDNFLAVRDNLETLFNLVVDELGQSWTSTVDYWKPDEAPPQISQVTIDSKSCWRGVMNFTATKLIEI